MQSGGIGKRPAALAGLGWPPMLAPMVTAFVLIFPISHPRIVMRGLPRIAQDRPAPSGDPFTHSLHATGATASRQAGINQWY